MKQFLARVLRQAAERLDPAPKPYTFTIYRPSATSSSVSPTMTTRDMGER